MTKMDELRHANPVKVEDDWGSTEAGHAQLATVLDMIEDDAIVSPAPAPRRKGWVYAVAGFAVTVAVVAPSVLFGEDPSLDPLALPGDPYGSINDDVLADGVVTEEEARSAADAVVSCTRDLSENPEATVEYEFHSDGGPSFTALNADIEAFEACHFVIFRGIERVYGRQNQPPRAESFYFYGGVVTCTEQQTGEDFGDMSRDPLGFVSTEGNRTINAALDQQRAMYLGCFTATSDQVGLYNDVLDCLANTTQDEFTRLNSREELEQRENTYIDEAGFVTLDNAMNEYPTEFTDCWESVTGGLTVVPEDLGSQNPTSETVTTTDVDSG